MSISESSTDPLMEIDTISSELANLENQFAKRQVSREQFELLSKELSDKLSNAESLAYSLASKDESIAKKLRTRNYNQSSVQQVCNHFIYGSKKPLEPEFGVDRIPVYFLEKNSSEKTPVDRILLERMADTGILSKSLFEKLLFCPKCSTPSNVYARFKCTQCGSIDISINRMIEHLHCGTIHEEKAFRIGDSMTCPTCKKGLQKPEEYRLIGLICSCNGCGAHFEDPAQSFFCRMCQTDFTLPTAVVTNVYTYGINEKILDEMRPQLGIPVIAHLLEGGGFQVDLPGTISAGSKEIQFSMIARNNMWVGAIDIVLSEGEVDVDPVLELYVKILEARPSVAVLGVVPGLSTRARNVAPLHNIMVAEGSTPEAVAQEILGILTKRDTVSQDVTEFRR